jgi:hypothetical protein
MFFIDIVAFYVMSNHYHLVAHVDRARAKNADPKEVVLRWHKLFKPKEVTRKYLDGDPLEPNERYQIDTLVGTWCARLHYLSWFMKARGAVLTCSQSILASKYTVDKPPSS